MRAKRGKLRMMLSGRSLIASALRLSACCAWVALSLPPAGTARGADNNDQAPRIYHKVRNFRIPFNLNPGTKDKIKELHLLVSEDYGYHWERKSKTFPNHPTFTFRASHDGEFWFAVQTLTNDGKVSPTLDSTIEPNMKVIVDSFPPSLLLEPDQRRGSIASVRWEVKDEHLDLKSLVLEYQVEGANSWRKVPISKAKLMGGQRWDAGTAEALKVRASVADRAGNVTEAFIDLPEGTGSQPDLASMSQGIDDAPAASQSSNDRDSEIMAGPGFTPVSQGPPSSRGSGLGSATPRPTRRTRPSSGVQAAKNSKTASATWDQEPSTARGGARTAARRRFRQRTFSRRLKAYGPAATRRPLRPLKACVAPRSLVRRARGKPCWSQAPSSSCNMRLKTRGPAARRPSSSGSRRMGGGRGFVAAATPTESHRSRSIWAAREPSVCAWSHAQPRDWVTNRPRRETRRRAGSKSTRPLRSSRSSPSRSVPAQTLVRWRFHGRQATSIFRPDR